MARKLSNEELQAEVAAYLRFTAEANLRLPGLSDEELREAQRAHARTDYSAEAAEVLQGMETAQGEAGLLSLENTVAKWRHSQAGNN